MKYRFMALLWMVLIFVTSSIPSYDFPEVSFWGWAKLIHLIYFGVLCFLFRNVLQEQKKFASLTKNPLLFAILFATVYGVTDEFHQLFTEGRHSQVSDVLIDALGASLYIAGAKLHDFYRMKRASAA